MRAVLSWTLLVPLLLISLLLNRCSRSPEEPIDLEAFRTSGDDWVVRQDTLPNGGILRLHHDKWLMYFVHWRPLTEEKEELSTEYVRNLMLNFWGPDMPFTLSEDVGEIEVAGHKAYSVDGTIYQGAIKSRFIVWNCPETKRQLIADCNINVGKGTPLELFELQNDITLSMSCHGTANVHKHPLLNHHYVSQMYNLSFRTPENWRTHEYSDHEWFPNGMTPTDGTLWTLLTDSEKYIELRWYNKTSHISPELFNQFVAEVESDSVVSKTTLRIKDIQVRERIAKNECIIGDGKFVFDLRAGERQVTKSFRFRAFLWNRAERTYFLLAGMATLEEFWGIPVDLSPTDETFNKFMHDEVLANTRVFEREYLK